MWWPSRCRTCPTACRPTSRWWASRRGTGRCTPRFVSTAATTSIWSTTTSSVLWLTDHIMTSSSASWCCAMTQRRRPGQAASGIVHWMQIGALKKVTQGGWTEREMWLRLAQLAGQQKKHGCMILWTVSEPVNDATILGHQAKCYCLSCKDWSLFQ